MSARFLLGVGLLLGSLGCKAEPTESAKGTVGVARASLPSATPAACGGSGQPDCPLQQWMKSTLQAYQREGNFERMAGALDQLKAHAPAGYGNWAEVAGNAAAAARKQDATAVRQACKSCHDEHRGRYRREMRAAPWL